MYLSIRIRGIDSVISFAVSVLRYINNCAADVTKRIVNGKG